MTGPVPHLKFSFLNKGDGGSSMFWTFSDDGGVFRYDWKWCETEQAWLCEKCQMNGGTNQSCENQWCYSCNPLCLETDLYTKCYFVWNKPISREAQSEYPFMFFDKYRDIDGYRAVLCQMRLKFCSTNAMLEICEMDVVDPEIWEHGISKYEISYFRFIIVKVASLGHYFRILLTAKWIKEFIVRIHTMFEQLEDLNTMAAVMVLNAVCNDTCVPVTEEEYMEFRILHCTQELDGITATEAVYDNLASIEHTFNERLTSNKIDMEYYPPVLDHSQKKYCYDDYCIHEIAQRATNPGGRKAKCLHVDPRIPITWRISFLREALDSKRRQARNCALLRKNGHLKIWQVIYNKDGMLLNYFLPLGFDFDNREMYMEYGFDGTELVITLSEGALCNSLIPGREVMDNKLCYVEKTEFDILHVSGTHCVFHPAVVPEGQHKLYVATINDILEKERGRDVDISMLLDWSGDSNINTFLETKLSRGIAFWEGFTHNTIYKC